MKKAILILSALIVGSGAMYAQNITGKVKDNSGLEAIGMSVELLKASDSSTVKFSATDVQGAYLFEGVEKGEYLVKVMEITDIAFSPKIKMAESNVEVADIIFKKNATELSTVVFTYTRPQVELKADKTVLNVEGTANATGQNGLELLRKSPGVLVDKDDAISLSGKNGVRLYIDGRQSPLTGQELSAWLQGLQAESIDAIEIITNPSAKYDAAGNAGIINIRLKKNRNLGTNGSVSLGYAQGVYPKVNGGITVNNRSKYANIYGSYNANIGKRWNEMNFERKYNDTFFDQKVTQKTDMFTHNFKTGVDFFLSEKSTIGLMTNGNFRNSNTNMDSETPITHIPSGTTVRTLESNNKSDDSRKNMNANANYTYSDKEKAKDFSVEVDYGWYDNKSDQYQPNIFFDNSGNVLYKNIYNIIMPTKINILSGKADYEQNLWGGRLGLGGRTAFAGTKNNYEIYNGDVGNWTKDVINSNEFDYKENIHALYTNYNKQFKGFMVQAGLRYEYTILEGRSKGMKLSGSTLQPYDTAFSRNYFDFFPSFSFTYNKNPMNQIGFAYSRRIDRPSYSELNPFELRLNEYSYRRGNTRLLPQYTNSFSITHSYKYMINTKLEYSHVNDMFAQIVDTASNSAMYQTSVNLAKQDIISLNVSVPFQYKKFSTFANVNTYYSRYQADFENRKVDLDVYALSLYGQATYKINEWLSAELSGWYTSPSVWQGTFRSIAMGGIDAGAQARLFKGNGNLKLSVGDIFNTMKWGGRSDFAGQEIYAYGRWESRQVRLNFTYNFGNQNVKGKKAKSTAAEEEKKRAEAGDGNMGGNGGR